jgi:glyoxylase-like metal-dependent hydrolase (beta-lactamase superfamily II)
MIDRRSVMRGGTAAAGALALAAGAGSIEPAVAATGSPSPTFLPLPQNAKPLPNNGHGFRLQRAGENGYVVISGFVQSVFVVAREGVILVDAPPASRGALRAAISTVTDKPVTHVIYSHDHLDHVGAVTDFPDATRIAHEEAAVLFALHNDQRHRRGAGRARQRVGRAEGLDRQGGPVGDLRADRPLGHQDRRSGRPYGGHGRRSGGLHLDGRADQLPVDRNCLNR